MFTFLRQIYIVLLGGMLVAFYFSCWIFPIVVALLIAFRVIRYREWLAILCVAASILALAGNGDSIYNMTFMPMSRFGPVLLAMLVVSFVAPFFLFILAFVHSRRRRLWGLAAVILIPLALVSMRMEFVIRKERDAQAYREGMKPLSPSTGTNYVRWWRNYRGLTQRILLQGHIPEKTRVVLLTDPFSSLFQPQFCTGTASVYWPTAKDLTQIGNATEVAEMQGCNQSWQSGVAVLERAVTSYQAVPFEAFPGAPDSQIPNHPVVRHAFEKYGYDAANFDWSKTAVSRAVGGHQINLFITAIKAIKTAPNAYPCEERAVLIGIHDLGNIKAVLPYCTLNWNLFQLNDDLFLSAVTQEITPPGYEIMNPEQTSWLFRVDESELKQVWPAP